MAKLRMCGNCGKANLSYMTCPKYGDVASFHTCEEWEERVGGGAV
jgi:hypothetical protein